MVKPDIRAETMLKWDEYKDKSYDTALPSIYNRAGIDAKRFATWYWTSIKTKRNTSLVARFLTFLLLIIGTLLPILAGIGEKPELKLVLTQLGVCSLALGGLLQIGDRVFGWSSGWIRYISTATAMENLARKFELDWAGHIIKKGGKLDDSDTKLLFDHAVKLQNGLMKLQDDETESWKTEFNSGGALLGDLIKSQRESTEKAADAVRVAQATQKAQEEAESRAKQPGAIEVSLVHKSAPIEVTIALDDGKPEPFIGSVWSRLKVQPGQHSITVKTLGASPSTIARVVDVKAGTTATLKIEIAP